MRGSAARNSSPACLPTLDAGGDQVTQVFDADQVATVIERTERQRQPRVDQRQQPVEIPLHTGPINHGRPQYDELERCVNLASQGQLGLQLRPRVRLGRRGFVVFRERPATRAVAVDANAAHEHETSQAGDNRRASEPQRRVDIGARTPRLGRARSP